MVDWCCECWELFDFDNLFSVFDVDRGSVDVCGDCYDEIEGEG